MRIECENCKAAYTIQDALLSDQPIGAQCPYCSHVKVVQLPDTPGAFPLPGGPASGAFGLPPLSTGPGSGFPPLPSAGLPNFGTPDFARSSGETRPVARFEAPSSPPPGPSPPAVEARGASCSVCGAPLADEFDRVIGLCELHQQERGGQARAAPAINDAEDTSQWRVRDSNDGVHGPFTLSEVRDQIQTSRISIDDNYAKNDFDFKPIENFAELRSYARRRTMQLDTRSASAVPRKATIARKPSFFGFRTVVVLLLTAGIGGAIYYGFLHPDEVQVYYQRLRKAGETVKPLAANPLARNMNQWRKTHGNVAGTADEHIATARARFVEDTPKAYQETKAALERALLLSPNQATAAAMYVETMLVWKGDRLGPEDLAVFEGTVRFAQASDPSEPSGLRAQAALDFSRGELNGCRDAAEAALKMDPTDGLAKLLLASSFVAGNFDLAIVEAEAALKMNPKLKRADQILARAYANGGRFASARKLVQERLNSDSGNGDVLILAGDIERGLGFFDAAKKHYERSIATKGNLVRARLALGSLLLEMGSEAEALEQYRRVLEDREGQATHQAQAYAGWARAELSRNRWGRAIELADNALKLAPKDIEALVLRAELALQTGSATTAEAFARRALRPPVGEPAALVVLGRAAVEQKKTDEALRHFEDAIQNDPNDPRLRALLASMYLTVGGVSQAFSVMRRAAEIDPLERDSRLRRQGATISEAAIREAIDRFREVGREEQNRSLAYSSIAVLEYHSGRSGPAAESVRVALAADENNVTALIYSAALALDRGVAAEARKTTDQILRVDRGNAVGHLLLGRALKGLSKDTEARENFEAAVRSSPGLLAAAVERAGLAAQPQKDRAQPPLPELLRLFRLDPQALRTRRLLLEAGY